VARAGGRQRSAAAGRPGEESDFFVRALARGLVVLGLFDVEHPAWGLSDIAERTGISKTTAYRMVRTLETMEYLAYDAQTERYHLGPATIPGAYLALSYVGFVRTAHPFLEELAEATGETVELTVGAAVGAVVVDEVATAHPFRLNRPIGRILDSMANSSFRMHVAFRPIAEQRRIVGSGPARLTPNTITDPAEIMKRLESERSAGLSYDIEEQDLRVCAVSASILERDGSLKAVLTLVAPAERFGSRERKRKSEALRSTAAEMTKSLGGRVIGG
jgi:IclR family acetate operon transcriptional repressor